VGIDRAAKEGIYVGDVSFSAHFAILKELEERAHTCKLV
jgi:hypothetical protein